MTNHITHSATNQDPNKRNILFLAASAAGLVLFAGLASLFLFSTSNDPIDTIFFTGFTFAAVAGGLHFSQHWLLSIRRFPNMTEHEYLKISKRISLQAAKVCLLPLLLILIIPKIIGEPIYLALVFSGSAFLCALVVPYLVSKANEPYRLHDNQQNPKKTSISDNDWPDNDKTSGKNFYHPSHPGYAAWRDRYWTK